MSMHERIKNIRTHFGLTQADFGQRVGLKRSYISLLESGSRNPSDLAIGNICRVYGVNHDWLVEGKGEMFGGEQAYIDAIVSSFGTLDPEDKEIIVSYLQLPAQKRRAFREFLEGFLGKKKDGTKAIGEN